MDIEDGGRRGRRTEMMEVEEEDKDGMEDRGGGDKNREDGEEDKVGKDEDRTKEEDGENGGIPMTLLPY